MRKLFLLMAVFLTFGLFALGCGGAEANAAAAQPTAAPNATAAATDAAATDAAATNDNAAAGGIKGSAADGTLELTLEQLKQFNGKNGNPVYVAVDGVIYDLTNVPAWKNGEHNGYSAGNDLTDIIKNKSPHGVKNLEGKPIVGKLVDG